MKYHYSGRDFTHRVKWERRTLAFTGRVRRNPLWRPSVLTVLRNKRRLLCDPLLRDKGQMGSLAGAAYLLNDNAGVLNLTQ